MTALDLTQTLNGFAWTMLEGVLRGLDSGKIDNKIHEGAMSIREHVLHLTEGYIAVHEEGEHEWGTYLSSVTDWNEQVTIWKRTRLEAIALLGNEPDAAIYKVIDNLAAHEFYHIGQMVLTRRWLEPNWNPDAIYEGA